MKEYRCTNCKGTIEATHKTYLTLRGETFEEVLSPDYLFYCRNDCFEDSTLGLVDLKRPEEYLGALVNMKLIERGTPAP